jgi:hypothetical protein
MGPAPQSNAQVTFLPVRGDIPVTDSPDVSPVSMRIWQPSPDVGRIS